MLTLKIYRDETLIEGAKLARTHRLFVSGWCLNGDLQSITSGRQPGTIIAIGSCDGKPVAIGLYQTDGLMQFFTRQSHRRQGIGTMIHKALKRELTQRSIYFGDGICGSQAFFKSLRK